MFFSSFVSLSRLCTPVHTWVGSTTLYYTRLVLHLVDRFCHLLSERPSFFPVSSLYAKLNCSLRILCTNMKGVLFFSSNFQQESKSRKSNVCYRTGKHHLDATASLTCIYEIHQKAEPQPYKVCCL